MKKLHLLRALFVGLLVWLPSAWLHAADWMAVGLYEQGAFYIDRETISRTGSIRKVWTMLDYRQPQSSSQGKTYRSTRTLMAFDCARSYVQSLSMSLHSGSNLKGEVLTSEGIIREWQPVPPQTPIAIIMANVCER
jgi:hypothetical protein